MELRHLQALTAISDHGTFSAAAEHLNTVQSNISAHVARLERELGAPLIDRADGRLTEEGTVVVARARRILSELDALVSDVAACKDEVTGTVRIGMIGTTARWLVPRLMDLARKRHPKLRLVVVEGNTSGLEPQLATGQLDLAVLHMPVSARDLVTRTLFEEDLMLVLPPGHAMADPSRPLTLEDLAEMELLLPLPGTAFRDELDAVTRPLGITLLPAVEIDGLADHRLAHLRGIRSGHPAGHGHPLVPARPVPSAPDRGTPPPTGRRGHAQPGPSLRSDPRPQRTAGSSGGGGRRPPRGHPRRLRRREVRLELGSPRLAPHTPDGRSTRLGVELFDDLETEAGVEGNVALLGRLEIGGRPGLVDAFDHRGHEGRSPALTLLSRLRSHRGQVPVRLLGMESVHLEQQTQGPMGAGAGQKGSHRKSCTSSFTPFLTRSGGPHRAAASLSSLV